MMSDTSYEHWCHLDQRRGEHVGDDERPCTGDRFGTATRELEPIAQGIEPRVLCGDAQRLLVDVDAEYAWDAKDQRGKREHARPDTNVEHRGRGRVGRGVVNR